jgi:hypothetical protein
LSSGSSGSGSITTIKGAIAVAVDATANKATDAVTVKEAVAVKEATAWKVTEEAVMAKKGVEDAATMRADKEVAAVKKATEDAMAMKTAEEAAAVKAVEEAATVAESNGSGGGGPSVKVVGKRTATMKGSGSATLPARAFVALGSMPCVYSSFSFFTLSPGFLTLACMM